jgi:hypothetical protein
MGRPYIRGGETYVCGTEDFFRTGSISSKA